MSGLEKGKAAHVKLQQYINTLVPEVDQHYSIVFDQLEIQHSFQRRTVVLVNGSTYLCTSSDVDYTGFIHKLDDYESDPTFFHLPVEAIKPLMNHRVLMLEDDSRHLYAIIKEDAFHESNFVEVHD